MSECPICSEEDRKLISCISAECTLSACRECHVTYILGSDRRASCMSCHIEWDMKFLSENFDKRWLTSNTHNEGYRDHLKSVALKAEKAKIPITLNDHFEERKRLYELTKRIERLNSAYKKKYDEIWELQEVERKKLLKDKDNAGFQFICACPIENCRGKIISNEKEELVCILCKGKLCTKCRVEITEEKHKCNPNDVKSFKQMKKDTKPCPKCAVGIYKIEGCFAPGTRIMLYDGNIVLSEDVELGMELMGDDGLKRIVIALTSGEDIMYRVYQGAANSYTVNSKHTLVLIDYDNEVIEMLIEDYINLSELHRSSLMGYKSNGAMNQIEVVKLDRGKYYGWKVSGSNSRFVLSDFTVVRNCSQMWCTACHTPFDWNTGELITNGNFHNPHAIRWYQENGGMPNQDEEGCGIPDYLSVFGSITHTITPHDIRGVHLEVSELYDVLPPVQDAKLDNLRLKYLLGDITEKEWRQAIFTADSHYQKALVKYQLSRTYVTIMFDEFRKAARYRKKHNLDQLPDKILDKMYTRFRAVARYINDCLQTELKPYGSRQWRINGAYLLQGQGFSK